MLLELILLFIPRFITEEVALGKNIRDDWYVICPTILLLPEHKQFVHAYGIARAFVWFGIGFPLGGKIKITKML